MRLETTDEDLDRGLWLSDEAQVGELRRLYALEEGGGIEPPRLSTVPPGSDRIADHSAAPSKFGRGGRI
jgi:hypothetical protein